MTDYISSRLFERKAAAVTAPPAATLCRPVNPGTRCLNLPKGRVIRIDPTHGPLCIECQHGRIWITESGIATDTILTAGESFKVGAQGRLVIEALEAACVAQTPETNDSGPLGEL